MKKMNVNKRNLKYGGFAVVLTALIIAAVTALGSAFSWYIDLTGSSVYSVSDEFYDHVDELMDVNSDNDPENDLYLNIVLLMEKDAFRDYNAYTYYVYHTINQITANCEYINLEYINSIQNPELVQDRYMKISGDTPAITDVIVEIAEKGEDGEFVSRSDLGFKKHAINSFYMADSESNSIIGYNAETKFLSAIAQLAGKVGEETSPTVYYLQGHSEPTLDEAGDWKKLFEDAGYIVKETNILSEDFPEKITKGSLVFINCPKTDLSASTSSGVSEIKKLRAFAATSYGNVIVTLDSSSTAASLPTLDALMSEWGVGIGGGITDDEHSVSGSGAVRVLADYSLTKTSIAKSIINKATGTNENRAPTLFTNPRAILVYDNSKIVSPTNSAAACEVLLAPYSSAKDPVNMAGFMIDNISKGLKQWHLEDAAALPRDGSVTLLDTRTPGEYHRGHISGFKNIPVDELRQRIGEIETGKPVYVICQSGLRSYIATRILEGHGYEAYNFAGGFRFYDAVMHDRALVEQALACGMEP